MFSIATMETNNFGLILAAMAANGVVWLLRGLVTVIAWLLVALAGFVVSHAATIAKGLLVVALVALVVIFWQAIAITAATFAAMYGGLKMVVSL